MRDDPFRTLDDPAPTPPTLADLEAKDVAERRSARGWVQPARSPNAWRRFWAWALLGWRWDSGE